MQKTGMGEADKAAEPMKRKLQIYSTEDLPAAQRVSRWAEYVSDTYAEFGVDTDDEREFKARLCRIQLGSIGMSWFETTASHGRAKRASVGQWSAPLSDAFLLSLQVEGEMCGRQFGTEVRTRPGDVVLIDATRSWDVSSIGNVSNITLKLPSEKMLALTERPADYCGRAFPHDPNTKAVSAIIIALRDAIEAAPDAEWDDAYEDVLVSAISTLFPRGASVSEATVREESLRRKAIAFIERNLFAPDLDGEQVAAELGVSVRTIQRLFNDNGLTPGKYILDRRIITAGEQLRSGEGASKITDLAYSLGFNDLSHFTRVFRKKFGQSPTEFRDKGGFRE
jgi:AraC-like DNA-binding protein